MMIEDLNSIISELKKRVELLERDNILNLSRIEELERANVSNLNMIFQISNELEEKIETAGTSAEYDTKQNYIVEHL
jgi:hypothetical protein